MTSAASDAAADDRDGDAARPHARPKGSTRQAGDVAEYVADLTSELATMARSSGLHLLAHLLEIARLEAGSVAGRETPAKPYC